MTTLLLDQIHLNHYYSGDPENPIIFFLHGFLGNGSEWDEVIKHLTPYYYCLIVDLPGHGKTRFVDNISFEETARALIQFLDQQNIKKCFLTGYSMGGRLALFLALRYSHYFHKTAIESALPGLRTSKEREERIAQDGKITEELESGDFGQFLNKWYRQPLFKGLKEDKNFDKLLSSRLSNNPKSLSQALLSLGTGKQPSLWNELHSCRIPILLIAGGDDMKYQLIASRMCQLSDLIQIKIVKKCSHNIHFQNPEKFAYYLHEFFEED